MVKSLTAWASGINPSSASSVTIQSPTIGSIDVIETMMVLVVNHNEIRKFLKGVKCFTVLVNVHPVMDCQVESFPSYIE